MGTRVTKAELRSHIRALRKTYVGSLGGEVSSVGLAIARHIETAIALPHRISGYDAMTPELDIGPALDRWRAAGHAILLPALPPGSGGPMVFREAGTGFETGQLGIRQPDASSPEADPELLLVPLLAADRKGNRLGQGGGHYDRALERLRTTGNPIAIGIAWPCQIADELPADSWDQRLDFIATPDELIAIP